MRSSERCNTNIPRECYRKNDVIFFLNFATTCIMVTFYQCVFCFLIYTEEVHEKNF
jgi:hypothetical protein